MTTIEARGITIELPPGWEAEVDGGSGRSGPEYADVVTPRVHIANFPLPPVRGDFGSGAVEQMIDGDALLCLLEETPDAASSRLYSPDGLPTVGAADFSPDAMQRPLKGQSGTQFFFHAGDRAFVLYVVLGSHASRATRVDDVNQVLRGITIH